MQLTGELYQQGALVVAGFVLAMLFYYVVLRPPLERRLEKKLRERKDEFIGLSSHYLLTPITIIQTAVARLQEADTTLDTTQRMKLYEAIAMGQQRLWIIAEQLVLVNQIDFNELRLRLEVANVSETVSDAIASVDIFARHKNLKLHFTDYTKEINQARFDPRRLRQAIIAVLDNAIKFSLENTTVSVELKLEGKVFQINIADQGIGMPPEVLEHITERFYRGNGIYNFDYEGLGLGLHIAYAIARQHGGNMEFTSQPKQGTTVSIQFPNI